MRANIFWEGKENHSMENCLVQTTDMGLVIHSTVDVKYNHTPYRVEYHIRTNQDQETIFLKVTSRHENMIENFVFESDGKGNWVSNDKSVDGFKGCIDVDIPITPATNSLPIHRLGLPVGASQEIQVLYMDILGNRVVPVKQKYTRLSDSEYKYENVPNTFEATIRVDELGFVVDYPGLFIRRSIEQTA